MRATFRQRRRVAGFRIFGRVDEKPKSDVPAGGAPINDDSSGDELTDDELSDPELDDGQTSDEESDDEEPPKNGIPPPPPPGPPGKTTSSISSQPTTSSAPPKETATTTPTSLPPDSSTLVSSQSIPALTTNTLLPSSSSPVSSSTTSIVSTSPVPVLNPGSLTTSTTTALPQSTTDSLLGGSTDVPQSGNVINPSDDTGGSASNSKQKAGEIAGGVIGGLAFVGILVFAIWMWRRRRNRAKYLSRMVPDDTQYVDPQPGGPGKTRSPSSIMNQLMTAAYAAEDGRDYSNRNSNEIFDNYANEKQGFTAHENESSERLTVPPAAQLRHESIAARTETTNKTESTWRSWGVLAGPSRLSQPKNWWVDRYFRT
ncbi:hypothetical protein F4803DRAFT_516858 [Xylaria telfairii]|nr:hypothetical protein F4803DRAFT_516858 [Xylaria telfairii]